MTANVFNGYPCDIEFARFINEHLAGKTILCARANEDAFIVHGVFLECTDGSVFVIRSEHDEGFVIEAVNNERVNAA